MATATAVRQATPATRVIARTVVPHRRYDRLVARGIQNGLLYKPGFFFTVRLHVFRHSCFDICVEGSQVAIHLLMSDAAFTLDA